MSEVIVYKGQEVELLMKGARVGYDYKGLRIFNLILLEEGKWAVKSVVPMQERVEVIEVKEVKEEIKEVEVDYFACSELDLRSYYLDKVSYYTMGYPVLLDFISGKMDRNLFLYLFYMSNLKRHGLLKHNVDLYKGINFSLITGLNVNYSGKFKNEDTDDHVSRYEHREYNLFGKKGFLPIHREIGFAFFNMKKREIIVMLMALRLFEGYRKSKFVINLSAFPINLTKTVLRKTLFDLKKKGFIRVYQFNKTGKKIYVDIDPKYFA